MRPLHFTATFFALFLCSILACSSNQDARTPREFVSKYSEAWRSGDVNAILALRSRKKVTEVDPNLKKEIDDASLVDERDRIAESIRRHDFSYTSWSNTEYVSDRDHEDHIHVSVSVAGVPSSIVLVREEGKLKIHPNPSFFR